MPKRSSNGYSQSVDAKKPTPNDHWALGLLNTMKDPNYIVKKDNMITVIKDVYPKAEYHYLVLPNEEISNLKSVNKEHLKLLRHMEKVARDLIEEDRHKDKRFKIGYHAEPSMIRLHLHVISDDMNSACLKTKKHWNSFTTDFFIKSEEVIKSLEEHGRVLLPSSDRCKRYVDTPLQCHKCNLKPKNMPDLKKHILTHIN